MTFIGFAFLLIWILVQVFHVILPNAVLATALIYIFFGVMGGDDLNIRSWRKRP